MEKLQCQSSREIIMNKLIIIGASGHGKVVADIARLNGYNDIVFLDDDESKKECAGYPVVGKIENAPDGEIFVAIGNNEIRRRISQKYSERNQPVLIHPHSVVAEDTKIGPGSVIMAGVVINPETIIGCGSIINTCSSVDHDCIVGDYSHIAVGAHLCGSVTVGCNTWVGAGATVINSIQICDNCMIGAGAVVVDDIVEKGTYIGIPARKRN